MFQVQSEVHKYKVKIVNTQKRKKAITRQLYHTTGTFDTVSSMKHAIARELSDEIKDINDIDFDIGYFEGKNSTKRWLVSSEDLTQMYSKQKSGQEIALWCDLDSIVTEPSPKRKHNESSSSHSSNRQEKEEAIDTVYIELHKKHQETYTKPQL